MLERYGVELIGADVEAIQRGEDRLKFKDIVVGVGGDVPALAGVPLDGRGPRRRPTSSGSRS